MIHKIRYNMHWVLINIRINKVVSDVLRLRTLDTKQEDMSLNFGDEGDDDSL